MEADEAAGSERVSIMTLHGAKGLEFETVFLPGWEEGLFPHQRSLDESGRAGLEEERRLAYVGLTRAKRRAKIFFATNRRIHGLWQATMPSRFIDELPAANVEVVESASASQYGAYGVSRFAGLDRYASTYETPGWRRAKEAKSQPQGKRAAPPIIEGRVVSRSTSSATFEKGQRVMHLKFGPGTVQEVDGDKLSVAFDHAGTKMVKAAFLERG